MTSTNPAAVVAAWNAAHKPGLLVQWRLDESHRWSAGVTWTAAVLHSDVPTVRLTSGRFVPLAAVRPHPAVEQLAKLAKVKPADLEFPPPDCVFCDIATYHDGDGFQCPQCGARWSSNGKRGSRPCVECCDNDADVTGDDGQPRCLVCAAGVLDGVLEATAPYECRRCGDEVTGIGAEHGDVWVKQLCGMHADADRRDAELDRWMSERAAKEVAA